MKNFQGGTCIAFVYVNLAV